MDFSDHHYPKDLILQSVRWYLRYSLSYRDIKEILEERGIEIDHTTPYQWVQEYAPQLEAEHRKRRKVCGISWRMAETCIRVKGGRVYFSRFFKKAIRISRFMLLAWLLFFSYFIEAQQVITSQHLLLLDCGQNKILPFYNEINVHANNPFVYLWGENLLFPVFKRWWNIVAYQGNDNNQSISEPEIVDADEKCNSNRYQNVLVFKKGAENNEFIMFSSVNHPINHGDGNSKYSSGSSEQIISTDKTQPATSCYLAIRSLFCCSSASGGDGEEPPERNTYEKELPDDYQGFELTFSSRAYRKVSEQEAWEKKYCFKPQEPQEMTLLQQVLVRWGFAQWTPFKYYALPEEHHSEFYTYFPDSSLKNLYRLHKSIQTFVACSDPKNLQYYVSRCQPVGSTVTADREPIFYYLQKDGKWVAPDDSE